MEDSIKSILNKIPTIQKERYILGIDGLSRSGKTTLVQRLSQLLTEREITFYVFHIDDHIVDRSKRYNTDDEEWYEYYYLQWDVTWLKDYFFKRLASAHQLILPFYDSNSDTQRMYNIDLPVTCLVIVEGVFLQRQPWRDYFDSMVYLDCPREKRFLRENEGTQKNKEKFESRYWKAEDYYLQEVEPVERADIVIRG